MEINKSNSYVLIHLLAGHDTATKISQHMTSVDVRSIQRSLQRLVQLGVIERNGTNHPTYKVIFEKLITLRMADKILEDESRPDSTLNLSFIEWLKAGRESELLSLLLHDVQSTSNLHVGDPMTAKELEYLTIELSWKSSALEGNTYTLLDTQLLLLEGVKAKNKTEFETQMILNHKNAVAFIVENKDLYEKEIRFSTVEELHRIISHNLGIQSGVRKRAVRISASNYTPLANQNQLREYADTTLAIISAIEHPVLRALLALALMPYLQTFEDGNKRTGRMLANAILISTISKGFSLRKVSARQLALAYLSFYEFNSLAALSKILDDELA